MTKRSDKAFRAEAVRLALSSGKSIAQTARELGVNGPTLYSWSINQNIHLNQFPVQMIN